MITRPRGARYDQDYIVWTDVFKGAPMVHFWAMIAVSYKSKLIFWEPTPSTKQTKRRQAYRSTSISQQTYINLCMPAVFDRQDELRLEGRHMVFQEDGASAHGTQSSENAVRHLKCSHDLWCLEDWPAGSPDLSPIENAWKLLKSRVRKRGATDRDTLIQDLIDVWDNEVLQSEIDTLIMGGTGKWAGCKWTDRLQECIDRDGSTTRF